MVHELGHALDIPHVEGSESMMYYLLGNQPVPAALSLTDTEALFATCGQTDDFGTKIRTFIHRFI